MWHDETTDEFYDDVVQYSGTALVDFHAEWCGPCRALDPILEDVEGELRGDQKIVQVDIDKTPELADAYGVSAIPCLVLFRDGEEVDRIVGLASKKKILKMMEK